MVYSLVATGTVIPRNKEAPGLFDLTPEWSIQRICAHHIFIFFHTASPACCREIPFSEAIRAQIVILRLAALHAPAAGRFDAHIAVRSLYRFAGALQRVTAAGLFADPQRRRMLKNQADHLFSLLSPAHAVENDPRTVFLHSGRYGIYIESTRLKQAVHDKPHGFRSHIV